MYKHNASSIKETAEKQFVSLTEKEKWNNTSPAIHNHDIKYNTKSEIDEILSARIIEGSSNSSLSQPSILNSKSCSGIMSDIEIFGRTEYEIKYEDLEIILKTGAIDEYGQFKEHPDRKVSNFISVEYGQVIYFYENGVAKGVNVYFYDENHNFIYRDITSQTVHLVNSTTVPYGIKHMKIYCTTESDRIKCRVRTYNPDKVNSVGTPREDGMYDVNIKSVGKNLFNPKAVLYNPIGGDRGVASSNWAGSVEYDEATDTYTYTGPNTPTGNYGIRFNNIPVKRGVKNSITFNYKKLGNGYDEPYIRIFDRNCAVGDYLVSDKNATFVPKDDYVIMNIYGEFAAQMGVSFSVSDIMVCVSDELDYEFEPYKESTTTITLPCTLDGIDKTADRLYKRDDGMWCIDKVIHEYKMDGSLFEPDAFNYFNIWGDFIGDNAYAFYFNMSTAFGLPEYPATAFTYNEPIIKGFLSMNTNIHPPELFYEGAATYNAHPNYLGFRFSRLRLDIGDKDTITKDMLTAKCKIVNYFIDKPLYVKAATTVCETIELPYLKDFEITTFDNCTNIFIDGPVLGTIRGKLPLNISANIEDNKKSIEDINESIQNINRLYNYGNGMDVVIDNAYKYIDSSLIGYTDDVKISGQVIENQFRMPVIEPSGACAGMDTDGKVIMTTGTHYYSYTYGKTTMSKPLKPNTTYTIMLEFENEMDTTTINIGYTSPNVSSICDKFYTIHDKVTVPTEKIVITYTTPNIIKEDFNGFGYHVKFRETEAMTNQQFYAKFTVLEGDYRNKTIPHINRLEFSGTGDGILISNTNENLFPLELYQTAPAYMYNFAEARYTTSKLLKKENGFAIRCDYSHDEAFTHVLTNPNKFAIPCESDTEYYLSYNITNDMEPSGRHQVLLYQLDEKKVRIVNLGRSLFDISIAEGNLRNFKIKTGPQTKYILLRFDNNTPSSIANFTNISLTRKPIDQYIPHEQYTKEIKLSRPLLSLGNGVCDTIEKINGVYKVVRRCGKKVYNGTEQSWHVNNTYDEWVNTTCFAIAKPTNFKIVMNQPFGLCDKLEVVADYKYPEDREKAWCNHHIMQISIKNERLNLPTVSPESDQGTLDNSVAIFKNWLKKSNITVYYELDTYQYEDIDVEPNILLRSNVNDICIQNLEGNRAVTAKMEFKIPVSLSNSVKSVMDKLDTLERMDIVDARIQLNTTYASDRTAYDFAMSLFNDEDVVKEVDMTLFELIYTLIMSGPENYDVVELENKIDFYTIIGSLDYEMADYLFNAIDQQYENCYNE